MPNYQPASPRPQNQISSNRRARSRRKKIILPLPIRVLLIAGVITVTYLGCRVALSNIRRPYVLRAQQSAEIGEKTQSLHEMEAENARLTQQSAFLGRPDGIEYEARLKGYLLPGERSLILTPVSNSANR